jgi:hypothetical protein
MLRLICGQLADREDYFALAVRMNCSISLSITKNIILHFNENWTTDDKWQFWCEYHGLIIPFGTMEHIIKISNGDAHPSNPIPETCLADLIRNSVTLQKQLTISLPFQLHGHQLIWEEKVIFDNEETTVAIGTKIQISFRQAKKWLASLYLWLLDTEKSLVLTNCTMNNNIPLMQYNLPKERLESGILFYHQTRHSFVTNINGNCVDEIEAPLLPISRLMVKKQKFLTKGQLAILRFLVLFLVSMFLPR